MELAAEVKDVPMWTSITIGQDMASAERATELVQAGMKPAKALVFIGSYGRVGWALEHLPRKDLLLRICDLWAMSDPDDTDPKFAVMWQSLFWLHGGIFLDGPPLPDDDPLRLYRGQKPGEASGISWSLKREVAVKFAKGAAERRGDMNGVVLEAQAPRKDILAYLTKRGEEEVIWLG
jgi:hypothetical protein